MQFATVQAPPAQKQAQGRKTSWSTGPSCMYILCIEMGPPEEVAYDETGCLTARKKWDIWSHI